MARCGVGVYQADRREGDLVNLEHDPGCPAIADDESDQVLYDYGECACGYAERVDQYVHTLLDEIKRDEDTIMHEPSVHPDVEFYLERIEANKAEIRRVRGNHDYS